MNKADLERALKNVRGAALKQVRVVSEDDEEYDVTSVEFSTEDGMVHVNVRRLGRILVP